MTKNFRKKEFSSASDTKHSLFMILMVNLALFMGSYFKILPWLWRLMFKILPWLWILALNSQRHRDTRIPIGVTLQSVRRSEKEETALCRTQNTELVAVAQTLQV